jgi:hypothetical protein
MTGVVLFIYALLDYLGSHYSRLGFHISPATHPQFR